MKSHSKLENSLRKVTKSILFPSLSCFNNCLWPNLAGISQHLEFPFVLVVKWLHVNSENIFKLFHTKNLNLAFFFPGWPAPFGSLKTDYFFSSFLWQCFLFSWYILQYSHNAKLRNCEITKKQMHPFIELHQTVYCIHDLHYCSAIHARDFVSWLRTPHITCALKKMSICHYNAPKVLCKTIPFSLCNCNIILKLTSLTVSTWQYMFFM